MADQHPRQTALMEAASAARASTNAGTARARPQAAVAPAAVGSHQSSALAAQAAPLPPLPNAPSTTAELPFVQPSSYLRLSKQHTSRTMAERQLLLSPLDKEQLQGLVSLPTIQISVSHASSFSCLSDERGSDPTKALGPCGGVVRVRFRPMHTT